MPDNVTINRKKRLTFFNPNHYNETEFKKINKTFKERKMDLTSIMPYIFTLFIGFFVVIGFFLGMMRGLKRSVARLIWLAASVVLLIVTITAITPMFMTMDVSFLNLSVNGQNAATLKEYMALSLSSSMNVPVDELGKSLDFGIAIFSMIINSIIFALLFFLLKVLTWIPYVILNKILFHDRGKKKYRIAGGAVGLVSGLLVALTFLSPLAGYVAMYDDVSKVLSDTEYADNLAETDEAVNAYKNDAVVKLLNSLGIDKYQLAIFNSVSKAKYGDTTFKLADEKDDIIKVLPAIIELSKNADSEEPTDFKKYVEPFVSLIDSNIFYTALVEFTPAICESLNKTDFGDNKMSLETKELMIEALNKLPELEKDRVKECLLAVADIATEAAKAEDVENCDFAKIGKQVDNLISLGFFSKEKINSLMVTAVESAIKSVDENSEVYDVLQKVIDKVKAGVNSYEKEFTAFKKIFGIKDMLDGDFSFETSGAELGAKIDELLAVNAEIIDKTLINDMLRSAIDEYAVSLTDEFTAYTDKIKNNLDKITSYEKEMSVFKIVFEMKNVVNDEFSFASDGTELGAKIDELLAANSAIIDRQTVNDFIGSTIDKYVKDNLSGDFASYSGTIKNNLSLVTSYENEFAYVAKLIDLSTADYSIENINDKDENGRTLGEKLDDISPSVLVGSIPLNVIGTQLDNYAASSENSKYSDILDTVKANYKNVCDNAVANGKTDGYAYSDITAAFAELYKAVTDKSSKVVGNAIFTSAFAAGYEETLAKLADNIVLGENGTRKIAIAIADDITAFIDDKPLLAATTQGKAVKEKLSVYKEYLARTGNLCKEPYTSETNVFADKDGNTFADDGDGRMRVNKPFTFIAEKLKSFSI